MRMVHQKLNRMTVMLDLAMFKLLPCCDHLRRALKGLQCRCKNPVSLKDPVTVITMLLIVSYEV